MKSRSRRIALRAAIILALPFLAISAIHVTFSLAAQAEIDRRGLPIETHNALKHAIAASEFYSALRPVFGAENAEAAVLGLGVANEWLERYLKHTTDWSSEVYKDLRNNISGVAAAEWLYTQEGYTSPCTRLRLIGKLAADGDLASLHTDPRLPPLPEAPDTASAVAKMKQDQAGLRAHFAKDLEAQSAKLRADLGLE